MPDTRLLHEADVLDELAGRCRQAARHLAAHDDTYRVLGPVADLHHRTTWEGRSAEASRQRLAAHGDRLGHLTRRLGTAQVMLQARAAALEAQADATRRAGLTGD